MRFIRIHDSGVTGPSSNTSWSVCVYISRALAFTVYRIIVVLIHERPTGHENIPVDVPSGRNRSNPDGTRRNLVQGVFTTRNNNTIKYLPAYIFHTRVKRGHGENEGLILEGSFGCPLFSGFSSINVQLRTLFKSQTRV